MKTQREFLATGNVFNLVSESGEDPDRVAHDRLQAEKDRRAAEAYARRMQRLLDEQCPGFIGGCMPTGASSIGEVLIEAGCAASAVEWLKRRFKVKAEVGIEGSELRVTIATKRKAVKGCKARRLGVSFGPIEQFELFEERTK